MGNLEGLAVLAKALRARLKVPDEGGYTTETILVTALLVVLALTVLGILAAKVIGKSNSINF